MLTLHTLNPKKIREKRENDLRVSVVQKELDKNNTKADRNMKEGRIYEIYWTSKWIQRSHEQDEW